MAGRRSTQGFAGLLSLLIAVAIILILASLYAGLFSREEDEKDEPGVEKVGGGIPAIRQAHSVELTVRLTEIRSAISAFEALEGRFPASIDELRRAGGFQINDPPEGYTYDYNPDTGRVALRQGDRVITE